MSDTIRSAPESAGLESGVVPTMSVVVGPATILAGTTSPEDMPETLETLNMYARVLESMVEGVSLSDEQGIIRYTNPAEDAIFGYERGELVGKHVSVQNVYPPEENRRIVSDVIEQLKTHGSWSGEFSNRKKDGTPFTTFARITAMEIMGRQYWVCVQEDVTERKLANEKLMASEARYRHIFQTAAVSIWEEDFSRVKVAIDNLRKQGIDDLAAYFSEHPAFVEKMIDMVRIVDVNETTLRLFKAESKERLLGSLRDVFVPATGEVFAGELLALANGDRHYEAETIVQTLEGDTLDVLFTVVFPPDSADGGSSESALVSITDITARKRAEDELKRSRDQLEVILEGIADGITVQNPHGQLVYANRAALKVLGFSTLEDLLVTSASSLAGRYELMDRSGAPIGFQDLPGRFALAGETSPERTLGWRVRESGELHWSVVKAAPVKDEQGRVWLAISIFRDITERIELEKRKDSFIALASHELKTPITSLKINAQLLQRRLLREGDQESARQMAKMDDQLDKLSDLVRTLLDVSKIEADKLDYSMSDVNMVDLVTETVGELQRLSDSHTILCDGIAPLRGVNIPADKERIRQVLTNLIMNALKYSPKAGRVVITGESSGDEITISVRDSGIGIPKNDQEQIFNRFFTVRGLENPRAETYPGLGLGLYISSEIVRRHGGRIWVESEVGKGSTFFFTLPRTRTPIGMSS